MNTVRAKMKSNQEDEAAMIRAHAGYPWPELFVWFYIRKLSDHLLPFEDFHIQILNAIKPGEYGKQVNIQAPRGTGKTTLVNRLIPLWRICYKDFDLAMDRKPEEFILIVGRNATMARQRITEIREVLETNLLIRRDFGDLVGSPWTKTATDTRNGIALRPLGRGSSPRGALVGAARPTLKLCDDIEDPKRCLNPDLRVEDRDWFMTDFMYAGDLGSEHSNTIIVDTVKHPESLSEHLRTLPGWRTLRYEAVVDPHDIYHPTAERLWKAWERLYCDTTLYDEEREENANAFYAKHQDEMTGGVTMLWPEKLPYIAVRKEIVQRGYHSVMRELQNDPRDPSMTLFAMNNALTFSVTDEGFRRSDARVVPWHDIGGFTTYLDTMGGRDAAENSYACAVVVAWEPLPGGASLNPDSLTGVNGYILLAWIDRVALTPQMENAILLAQRAEAVLAPAHPKSLFVCEQRPDNDGTIRQSTDHAFRVMKDRHRFQGHIMYHEQHQNKEDRIATLEPAIANGWLAFNEKDLPGEFWTQFRQFPTADHNDAPDAVQGAVRSRITTTAPQRANLDAARRFHRNSVARL
ncbi:MAG: hypothetical protein OXI86_19165 [Candidatus Poribacteria bacterium]|nr:hypothetical protein [Candidatus Poribacteria bacterium]